MGYEEYITAGHKKRGNGINSPRALFTAVIPHNRRKWTAPRRLPNKTLEVKITTSEADQLGLADRVLGAAGCREYREPRECKHNAERDAYSGAGGVHALVD